MPLLPDAEPSVRPALLPGLGLARAGRAAERGRWIADAARQALTTPWHLAVLAGPDEGTVIPLPAGRSIVGRSATTSTDPAVAREAFAVAVSETGVTVQALSEGLAWRGRLPALCRLVADRGLPQGQCQPWRPGTQLRVGNSIWELRARPREIHSPPLPQQWASLGPLLLMMAVPLILVPLVVLRSRAMGMSERGAWSLLLFAPLVLMMVLRVGMMRSGRGKPERQHASRRSGLRLWRRRRFDPCAALLLLASELPSPSGEVLRGWIADRRRRFRWEIQAGDRIALVGSSLQVLRTAIHVLLMAAVNGAQVSSLLAAPLPDGQPSDRAGEKTVSGSATSSGARSLGHSQVASDQRHVNMIWQLAWGAIRSPEAAPEDGREFVAELRLSTGQIPAQATRCPPLAAGLPRLPFPWLLGSLELLAPGTSLALPRTQHCVTPTFQGVIGRVDRDLLGHRWTKDRGDRGPSGSLEATLGLRGSEEHRVSLVEHGPHALLAGTTGSGKSELLTSWLLQLACQNSPEALCLILVDYKGGAAFGALSDLPHTAGVLTDLAPALTDRVLRALEAEVARRERRLAAAQLSDWRQLDDGEAAPRIVIAVDEFQVLAQTHADVLDALLRIAAQGRSLGMHLILSTQRPHGAISPTIRANTALRLCMRVLDGADSREVLGSEIAASPHLPPGSVFIAGPGNSPQQPYLSPWCAPSEQSVLSIVDELQAAAHDQGLTGSSAPWAPPLPERRQRSSDQARRGVVALIDEPAQQQWQEWSWESAEPLLLLGAPRSGRTMFLEAVALSGMARAFSTAAKMPSPSGVQHPSPRKQALFCPGEAPTEYAIHWALGNRREAHHPTLLRHREAWGSVLSTAQPRALSDLWQASVDGTLDGGLLLIDDLESHMACLEQLLGPGQAQPLWEGLLRRASAGQLQIVVTAALTSASARWVSHFTSRLYLGIHDAAAAALAGLPRSMAGQSIPGRGVLWRRGETHPCQLLVAAEGEGAELTYGHEHASIPDECHTALFKEFPSALKEFPSRKRTRTSDNPGSPESQTEKPTYGTEEPRPRQHVIRELPSSFHATAERWAVLAPHGFPAPLPRRHIFIAGPAGSGRTSTLQNLQAHFSAEDPLIVWDFHPANSQQLQELQEAAAIGQRIILSTTLSELSAALRTSLAPLRDETTLLLLSPSNTEASQLLGRPARPYLDPLHPHLPGRGILVDGTIVRTIQVGLMDRVSSATSR